MEINITQAAAEEIKSYFEGKDGPNLGARIFIEAFGWGGPKYRLKLDASSEKDEIYEVDGFKFVIDKQILNLAEGFELDLKENAFGKRIDIRAIDDF